MNTGKAAVASVGFMGPVLAVIVLALNQFVFKGNVITDADVSSTIDHVTAVIGLVTGAWGRWRATKAITSVLPQ